MEFHNRRTSDRAWCADPNVIGIFAGVDFSLPPAGVMRDCLRRARKQHSQLKVFQSILDNHPQYRQAREHRILCEQAMLAADEIEKQIRSHADGIKLAQLRSFLNERYEELLIKGQFDPHIGLAAHIMREAYLVTDHLIKIYNAEYRLKLSDESVGVKKAHTKADSDHKRTTHMRRRG